MLRRRPAPPSSPRPARRGERQEAQPHDDAPPTDGAPPTDAGRADEPAGATQPGAPAAAPGPAIKAALETFGLVIAPATVLTALLFYFGWMQTRTFALGVGIHLDMLGYGTQDYVLRSADSLFWPLVTLCLVVLGFLWLHSRVNARMLGSGRITPLERLARGLAAASALLVVGALLAAFRPAGVRAAGFEIVYARWAPPLILVLGLVGMSYAAWLRRRLAELRNPGAGRTGAWAAAGQRAMLGGLVLLGLFWTVTAYAQDVGAVRLADLGSDAEWRELPTVVLYSPDDLRLDAPGVVTGRCPPADAAYRFRYTGLRLFAYANERYFLLPASWPRTGGPAIVLADDPAMRVELLPATVEPDPGGACPPED